MNARRHNAHLAVVEPRTASQAGSQAGAKGLPTLPEPSRTLISLLAPVSSRVRYSSSGEFLGEIEEWKAPAVTPDQAEEVSRYLQEVEQILEPADRGALLTRVLALLSHYRSDGHPPQVERMIAEDWAEDLQDFPMWAIEAAARWWRRNKKFRPAICEIRGLCEELSEQQRKTRDRLHAILRQHRRGDQEKNAKQRIALLASQSVRRVPGSAGAVR